MKRTLLLLFSLCFSFSLVAQDITVDPMPVVKELGADDGDVKVDFNVNNNTNRELTVFWEFDRGTCPDEWTLFLCDVNLCYTEAITSCPCSQPNSLAANSSNVFMMHVIPNGVMGVGTFTLKILDECNGTVSMLDIPITFDVDDTSSAAFQDIDNNINIYPNPSSHMLNIKEDKEVSDIIIYNLIGKKIRNVKHSPGMSHDISDLERGIYLIRMLNKEQNILKVSRLTKK